MNHYTVPNRNGSHSKGHLIKVTGEGTIHLQPDTASVNLGIITEMKELLAAQQQNSKDVAKVIEALRKLGIPANLIQTSDYRIETEYDYDQGKQLFRDYKINHLLQVKIEDLSLIGKVVDTAVQNGVNFVSNIQFSLKDKDSFYLQALNLALNNATEKAKTIASNLNVTLIPTPSSVVEAGSTAQPIHFQAEALMKGTSSTPIEPGQVKISAVIAAEFHFYSNI
ncbi:SIMPL domain-containing protein [Neobacillus cucumis]|uniref:SIMPL domain-containing protein n=1 Tax=Neobacillus cucumis TaxID=1740721 RepID=UPI0028536AE1|nr:SIMPL domain-containing protein [Neobacillus cucumis]MDR4948539.1 SIMPL domain-containing protein [Neobacillus cucumis]